VSVFRELITALFYEQIRPAHIPERFDANPIRLVRERQGGIFELAESFDVGERPRRNVHSQPGTVTTVPDERRNAIHVYA